MKITKKIRNEVIRTVSCLHGFFPRFYVGGSYALELVLNWDLDVKDVDIFILEPKRFESWALEGVLKTIFDSVDCNINGLYKYKIDNQYKRIKATKNNIAYDLIFADISYFELLTNNTASDLSKFYFKLLPSIGCKPCSLTIVSNTSVEKALINILLKKHITINKSMATEQHLKKLETICMKHDLDFVCR